MRVSLSLSLFGEEKKRRRRRNESDSLGVFCCIFSVMHLLRAATNKKVSRLVSPRDEEEAADDENVDDTNDGRGFALDAGRTGVESRTTRTTTGRTTTSFASSAEKRCCFGVLPRRCRRVFSSRSFHQRKGSVRKRKKSKSSNRDDDDDDDDVKDVMFDETRKNGLGLAKQLKTIETRSEEMKAREEFVRNLARDTRARWNAKKEVDKVETPNGKIAVGVGRCGHPRESFRVCIRRVDASKEGIEKIRIV